MQKHHDYKHRFLFITYGLIIIRCDNHGNEEKAVNSYLINIIDYLGSAEYQNWFRLVIHSFQCYS